MKICRTAAFLCVKDRSLWHKTFVNDLRENDKKVAGVPTSEDEN